MIVIAPADAKPAGGLPALVDRAASALAHSRTAAEILEASEFAGVAYDAAKRVGRLAKAKDAHDTLVAAAHRAQADALEIEAKAKRRLADEYDAAQERGEIRANGERSFSSPEKVAGPDVIAPKALHEARQIRDAEHAAPGIVRQTLDARLAAGEEPSRAALRRAIEDLKQAQKEAADADAAPKAAPLTDEQRAAQVRVFGTQADRAIASIIDEIVDRHRELPAPAEAARRIPPAIAHAVNFVAIRETAAWLNQFADLWERDHVQDAAE